MKFLMKRHHSPLFAFALLLCVLLPATATPPAAPGQMIELNIVASSSTFGEHPLTVQVREGESRMITLHAPGQAYYQYMIRAQRPALDSLAPVARKIPNPLAVSIRVDASDEGKTWKLQTHANLLTTLGSTVSAEISDTEKSTSLLVSSRLLPAGNEQVNNPRLPHNFAATLAAISF